MRTPRFIRSLALLCILGAVSSRAQPVLGTPLALPGVGDGRAQLAPAVASDGDGVFLVVWQQGKLYHQSQTADLYAVRINSAGELLDPAPVTLSTATGTQEAPKVSYAGGTFLVVWQDTRNGQTDVYAARVGTDGSLVDPNGIRLTDLPSSQAMPTVAGHGGAFAVAWQSSENGRYELFGTTVAADGTVGQRNGSALTWSGAPLRGGDLDLTSTGTRLFLERRNEWGWRPGALNGMRDVVELSVQPPGLTVLGLASAATQQQYHFSGRVAAVSPDRWLLISGGASRDSRFGTVSLYEGLTVQPNPNVAMSSDSADTFRLAPPLRVQGVFGIAGSDGEALIAFRDLGSRTVPPSLRVLRVDANGLALDSRSQPPQIEVVDAYDPAVAANRSKVYLVAYEVTQTGGPTVVRACLVRSP